MAQFRPALDRHAPVGLAMTDCPELPLHRHGRTWYGHPRERVTWPLDVDARIKSGHDEL